MPDLGGRWTGNVTRDRTHSRVRSRVSRGRRALREDLVGVDERLHPAGCVGSLGLFVARRHAFPVQQLKAGLPVLVAEREGDLIPRRDTSQDHTPSLLIFGDDPDAGPRDGLGGQAVNGVLKLTDLSDWR